MAHLAPNIHNLQIVILKCYISGLKAHSSNTPCPTPIVSTCSGPSSSHTVDTEEQLSVSEQLNSQELSAEFCAFAKPWSIFGMLQIVHWWYLWVKETLFLWIGPEKVVGKHFHMRRIQPR